MTDFENFVRDRGWEFKTEEALQAAFARATKGSILSEDEFIAEVNGRRSLDTDKLKEVYAALKKLVDENKLRPTEVFMYAKFGWCLQDAEAIKAYETEQGKWTVNNCDTEISEAEALVAINSEWGFEVSRIKLIGKAYYESTDWQYMRFDCAHMTWLWKNDNLYMVYN